MRLLYLISLLSLFTFVACGDEDSSNVSRQLTKAVYTAAQDGDISAKECESLRELANEQGAELMLTTDTWEQFLQENKPRGVTGLTIDCPPMEEDKDVAKVNLGCGDVPRAANFYVENSRSMYGYLINGSNFQNVMSDYVLRFNQQEQAFTLNFINNEVFSLKSLRGKYAGTDDVFERKRHFESYLNRQKMDKLGKTGSSKLMEILNVMTNRAVESCEAQFLVSDFIYSLSGVTDMKRQMDGIQSDVSLLVGKVTKVGMGTLLIKYNSTFEGSFFPWNSPNKGFIYKGQRPYYIWVFGAPTYLQTFVEKYAIDKQAGYEASALFVPRANENPAYGIFPNSGDPYGEFRKSPRTANPVHELSDVAASSRRGAEGIRLALGIDLTPYPVSKNYLANLQNYKVVGAEEENWRIAEIIPVDQGLSARDEQLIGTSPPSHFIILEADDVESESSTIKVRFLDQKPAWLIDSHTDKDDQTNINEVTTKTFGFSYLSDGIWEAYHNRSVEPCFFEIPITLKR
jgi:hypothetical protein